MFFREGGRRLLSHSPWGWCCSLPSSLKRCFSPLSHDGSCWFLPSLGVGEAALPSKNHLFPGEMVLLLSLIVLGAVSWIGLWVAQGTRQCGRSRTLGSPNSMPLVSLVLGLLFHLLLVFCVAWVFVLGVVVVLDILRWSSPSELLLGGAAFRLVCGAALSSLLVALSTSSFCAACLLPLPCGECCVLFLLLLCGVILFFLTKMWFKSVTTPEFCSLVSLFSTFGKVRVITYQIQ